MLRGHVFDEQLFSNDCFALFIDTFLAKNCGVVRGCDLIYTSNSVTINPGYFCIGGRFLEEEGTDTINTGLDNAYCILVCEIDLSKENTESELTQASYKIVKGTNNYSKLVQQDLTYGGTIYQFEFARFRTGTNGITEFKDTRAYLDFDSIYSKVNAETQKIIEEIKKELENVKDGSAYILKNNLTIIEGKVTAGASISGSSSINYPAGFNKDNCIPIAFGSKAFESKEYEYGYIANDSASLMNGAGARTVLLDVNNIKVWYRNYATDTKTFYYKITLLKIM